MAFLKQCLEDKEVEMYAWIEGKEIVSNVLTKQGLRREGIDKILIENFFRNALDLKNCLRRQDTDGEAVRMREIKQNREREL